MQELTAFAAPGHNGWDALIIVVVASVVAFLAYIGKRGQDQYRCTRADHTEAALRTVSPDQAHAIAALGPVPPPRTMGILLALLVAGLALAGGARSFYADSGKNCDPPCIKPQVCRGGICTGTADARILSMLMPDGAAAREVPGSEDTEPGQPFQQLHQDPVALNIKFGGEQ